MPAARLRPPLAWSRGGDAAVLRLLAAALVVFTLATFLLVGRLDPDEDFLNVAKLADGLRRKHRAFAGAMRSRMRGLAGRRAQGKIRDAKAEADNGRAAEVRFPEGMEAHAHTARRATDRPILPKHVLLRFAPIPPIDRAIFPPDGDGADGTPIAELPHAEVPRYVSELAPVKVKPLPPPKPKPPKDAAAATTTTTSAPSAAIHASIVAAGSDADEWASADVDAWATPEDVQPPPRTTTSTTATQATTRANKGSNFHLDAGETDRLLGVSVDVVLNQILLDMRGSITCGGRPLMEFRTTEDVMTAAADDPDAESPADAGLEVLNTVLPESDVLGTKELGTCAVVGNSGVLLNSSLGEEIDSHDTVIRFNAAPTKKFEEDVGTKTTVRIQNVDHLGFHEHQDGYKVFSFRNAKDLKKFIKHKRKYARGGGRSDNQYAFNPEFWCHVWDWVHHRKLKPTTGLAGVVLALHGCERGHVDLYGFAHGSEQFHYFNKLAERVTKVEVYRYHPLLEEAALYRELASHNLTRSVTALAEASGASRRR